MESKKNKHYQINIDVIPLNVALYRWMDDDFVFIDFNKLAEKTEDILRDEVIGKRLLEAFPAVKEFGLYDVLLRVYESGESEEFDLAMYQDERIRGWRKNSIVKLPNGDIMAIYEDLTEHKELKTSNEKFQQQLETAQKLAHLGSWEWDIKDNIINWSDEVYRIFGEEPQSFIPNLELFLNYIPKAEQKTVTDAISQALENKTVYEVSHQVVRKDKNVVYVKEVGNAFYDEKGEAISMVGTIHDITQLKLHEIAEKDRHDKIQNFQEALLSWSHVDSQNLSETISKACETLAVTMGVSRVSIWLYNNDKSVLACFNLFELEDKNHSSGMIFDGNDYPKYFEALKEGVPLVINEVEKDKVTQEFLDNYLMPLEVVSMLDVPIMSQGDVIGVLCNEHTKSIRHWDIADIEFSNAMASSIALAFAIEKRQISEKKSSRVSKLINNSQTIVFYLKADEHWSVDFVSENIEQFGYSSADFILNKLKFSEIIHPDDLEQIMQEVLHNTKNSIDKFTQVYRILTRDKSVRWVDGRTVVERDEQGVVQNYLGTIIDITEQKLLESELSLLGSIIDNSLNEIYIFDPESLNFTYANKAAQEHSGYTFEEFKQLTPVDIKPEFTKRSFLDKIKSILSQEKDILVFETYHERKDKTTYQVEIRIQEVEVGGINHLVAIALDISERKETEKRIKESEEKFRSIAENVQMGIFIYQERYIYLNDAYTDMTGYTLEDLQDKEVWDIVEESMQEKVRKASLERLKGQKFPEQYSDVKLLTKHMGYRTFRITTQTIHFNDGYAGLGTMIDITDIKETKKQLTVLAQAVEQTDDLVRIVEADGTISYVNDSFIANSGYTRRELIGQNSRILKSGQHPMEFYKELWDTLLAGQIFRCRFINRKKTGAIYYEEATVTPILDENQKVLNFVVTGKNVTDKIKLEEELTKRATTDELTGLYNRHKGNELLDQEIERADRYNEEFAVIFFDIDYFKMINDTYGHDIGDSVLKQLSQILQLHTRKSDAIIRWGGEEFIILALNQNKDKAFLFAQNIRKAIELCVFNTVEKVTVSIGVASFKQGETKESLIKRSDDALYKAKENGRNCVVSAN